jgi:elongator complex protein 3
LVELRRLGVTRVQIGCQSLSDDTLVLNRRDHTVEDTRQAVTLLRRFGFKVQAHWMANLLGTSPDSDVLDFARLFADEGVRPDELKIYPCVLVPNSELAEVYERGDYVPYTTETLVEVLARCLCQVPPYCRVNRLMRDIPGTDVLGGSRHNSLRARVEARVEALGFARRDIRSREVRGSAQELGEPKLETIEYRTDASLECFVQFVADDRLCGFARLSLPNRPAPLDELRDSALLREVHVYGQAVPVGTRSPATVQHQGLGTRLVEHAVQRARRAGYDSLAVISSVGTRRYYRRLGFAEGRLYQHRRV